uniref:Uncharacterized protein n=1 Tax=Rhizophora mucronata TaxID=61149 RepID=A0A2P2MPV1_RHIMU
MIKSFSTNYNDPGIWTKELKIFFS